MFEKWKESWRKTKLENAIERLQDQCYDLQRWSFADRPSRHKARISSILDCIKEIDDLGGNPLREIPYRYEYLVAEALPSKFVRVYQRGRWVVVSNEPAV